MVMPLLLQDKLELQPEQRLQMVNLRQHFLQSLTECHESREAICLGLQQVSLLPSWFVTQHRSTEYVHLGASLKGTMCFDMLASNMQQ